MLLIHRIHKRKNHGFQNDYSYCVFSLETDCKGSLLLDPWGKRVTPVRITLGIVWGKEVSPFMLDMLLKAN